MMAFRFLFTISVLFCFVPSFAMANDVFNPYRGMRFRPKLERCSRKANCSDKVRNPGRCPLPSEMAPMKGFERYLFLARGSQCCRSDADCSIDKKCCFSSHYSNLRCTDAKTVENSTTITPLINGSSAFPSTGKLRHVVIKSHP